MRIEKALKTLNEILVNMQYHQKKRQTILPRLKESEGLCLLYAKPEDLTKESYYNNAKVFKISDDRGFYFVP